MKKPEQQQRVLVVDDDPYMLSLLRTVLEDLATVITAEDGAQALTLARVQPQPDLILLDVSMPGMNGHEACRQLKADPDTRDIPVIFTTAAGLDEDEAIGFSLGAADYITKPFRLPVVRARVRAHLEARQLYLQVREHNHQLDEKVRERTRALEEALRSRRQAEERFVHQVYHDGLTALPNRAFLQRKMYERLREPAKAKFALVVISLLGFHEINNTLGYENGSQMLRQVAQRLNERAAGLPGVVVIESGSRASQVAVMSGVNFSLLLEPRPDDELLAAAQALLDTLEPPFEFEGMSLNVGGLAGIALSDGPAAEPDQLFRYAQIAVEESAATDKRATVYSDGINRYSARRLSLMGELRTAIQQDALKLVFQPQLDMRGNRVVRAEALLRWQHPRLGSVPPDEFIPLAEQTGVIKPLTAWVMRAAVRQCRAFIDQGAPLGVSINLSARNLREADLPDQLMGLLAEFQVPPELLVLEVTETVVMQHADVAMKVLTQLESAGVRSSIDDFGTGYSSLGYLKRLPVSEVKIDRSFVMDMLQDKDDRLIVETIIDMGHNLGLEVVAEGVENATVLDTLRGIGCDLAQGHHLSRPIPGEDLLAWLKASPYGGPSR